MNLEQGKLRLRRRGGDGGHNGIKSVIGVLGTKEFPRMRIGIGHPPDGINDVEYVLGKMTAGEKKMMTVAVNSATEAVICAATLGLTEAMNRFN
jgi:PTH1 family peptidyl-tRNA hydrolase